MIATFLFAYFGIALLALATDGMVCYATARRFRVASSTFFCLFWPVSLPLVIVITSRMTRSLPPPEADEEEAA